MSNALARTPCAASGCWNPMGERGITHRLQGRRSCRPGCCGCSSNPLQYSRAISLHPCTTSAFGVYQTLVSKCTSLRS